MAIRGQKPKPSYLRAIDGGAGHRPLNEDEPKPPGKLLEPPAFLSDSQRDLWFAKLAEASLSARCEVWPELVSSVLAVERMAIAPSVTVRRCSSTRWRKAAIACSMMERRSCCSCIEARSRSASRRSVMSSWVATQDRKSVV